MAFASVLAVGCEPAIETPSSPEPRTVSPNIFANESWSTYSPASPSGPATLVVQYNGPFFGWSWSEDGVVWTTCNAAMTSCGPGGITALVAPAGATFRGDPAIAAASDGSGAVVALNLLTTPIANGQADSVGVMLSLDGGRTFESAIEADADGPCGDVPGDLAVGRSDQPAIAWDADTNVFYVAWRQSTTGQNSQYGACLRPGTVDVDTRRIVWLDDAHFLPVGRLFGGIGGLHVAAGGGALLLAYADATDGLSCSTSRTDFVSLESFDLGRTWSNHARSTMSIGGCVGANNVTVSHRGFGIARNPQNGAWWAVFQRGVNSVSIAARDSFPGGYFWRIVRTDPWPTTADVTGLIFPTIAIDHEGRVGVSFTTSDAGGRFVRRFAGTAPNSAFFLLSTIGSDFLPALVGPRQFGDYDVMTAIGPDPIYDGSTFLATWAQTESDGVVFGGVTEVVSQLVRINRP